MKMGIISYRRIFGDWYRTKLCDSPFSVALN